MIYIIFLIIFISIIFYFINNLKEEFYVPIVTWKPSFIDLDNQPGYSNYFYNNGYMYPVY
jgi:hypothetical protein